MKNTKINILNAAKRLAATVLIISSSAAMASDRIIRIPIGGGFPAVNLIEGQQARVVLSNVLVPTAANSYRECAVKVKFLDPDGSRIGSQQTLHLKPGASLSIARTVSESGLVRAVVRVITPDTSEPNGSADPDGVCAITTTLEIFDVDTGRTLFVVPAVNECLGGGCHYATENRPSPYQ